MPANRITRKQSFEGIVTPAFIHNSGYHFTNLEVYEDGLVNCWHVVDLGLFRKELDRGWVVPTVPEGATVSVHGLGTWKVSNVECAIDGNVLYKRVVALLRELNPEMQNLHKMHGSATKPLGQAQTYKVGVSHPREAHRLQQPDVPWSAHVRGRYMTLFVTEGDTHYLADVRIFKDGVVEIGRVPTPTQLSLADFEGAIAAGRVRTSFAIGTRVHVHDLCSFELATELSATKIEDKLTELKDELAQLNGSPGAVQICRVAFAAYQANPGDATRATLRAAYEAVPGHQRLFVGDMDDKDRAVRAAIYGEEADADERS